MPNSTSAAPTNSENPPVKPMASRTRRRRAAVSRAVWARVISGISRPESAASTENGKKISGSAMPFKEPYCATASARVPR